MRAVLCAGLSGLLFGVGLIVAGMTNPGKILAFFDFAGIGAGAWDPSLALVLAAALGTSALGYRLVMGRRAAPLWAPSYALPERSDIDGRLIGGAALFGIGWGLVGYCPGPALVAVAGGAVPALVFVTAMAVGMVAWTVIDRALVGRPARA